MRCRQWLDQFTQALVSALGPIDAIRFLQQVGSGVGNYTAERHQLLTPVTREEFWQDIQRIRARKANLQNSDISQQ